MDDEGVMLRWHKGVYKGWVLAERCPLIRPAGTSRRLDATLGRREGFFGFGATNMSRLRRWDGVLAQGHEAEAGFQIGNFKFEKRTKMGIRTTK